MNAQTTFAVSAALGLGFACGSNSDVHSPMYGDGGATADGASGARSHVPTVVHSGAGGTAEAGASGEAEGGDITNATGGLEQGMVVQVPPSACAQTATWAASAAVTGVSTGADERLLSITPDELDIAFARAGVLYRAHRAAATDGFDAGRVVAVPSGYGLGTGAALSADAASLVLVQSDGKGFAALERNSRSGDFGADADPTPFKGLNDRAVQTMEQYASPVLSSDGKRLIFASFTPAIPGGRAVVYESLWSGDHWATPASISDGIFDGTTEQRALPTGLASDSRTLFYYDEAAAKEVARFRDRPDAPLYTVVDFGGRDGAAPNVKCDRLYYSSNGNIVVESK